LPKRQKQGLADFPENCTHFNSLEKLMIKRIIATLSMAVLLIANVGCSGPLSRLDSTLDYAPFFFQGLVISGTISQAQAALYKQGVDQFELVAEETKTCLSEDIKTNAVCYNELRVKAQAAIAQYYPAVSEGKVAQYVTLLGDIVDLIIRKNTPSVGASAGRNLDKALNAKIDELETLLKSERR
jgi:hypothetical protein